jgi:hypothetical protein
MHLSVLHLHITLINTYNKMPEEINYNHHMSYEQHLENEYQRIQEQLESDYKTYCNHCDDKPLSFNDWLYTDSSAVYSNQELDDLPF